MATKFSEFTSAGALTGTEEVVGLQGGDNARFPHPLNELASTASGKGAALVGHKASGAGAIASTVSARLRQTIRSSEYSTAAAAMADAVTNSKIVVFSTDATVVVPTDVSTLQAAIDAIDADPGVTVTINIATGHALTAGFRVDSRDCSFIRITSTDATVPVSPSFTFVSNTDLSSDVPRSAQIGFLAVRAVMPRWEIKVDMTGVDAVTGYELDYTSSGTVAPAKGVINTTASVVNGVNCRVTTGSRLTAAQSVWTGAKNGNVAISHNSAANLQDADLSNTNVEACLDVSRGSVVHALGINCTGGTNSGIHARRSFVSAQGANFTNCGIGVIAALASFVGVPESVFDGCTVDTTCTEGSIISLGTSTKSSADMAAENSTVANTSGGTSALRAFNVSGGWGCVYYEKHLPGNAEYLTKNHSVTITSATQQNIASMTFATALSLTGKKTVFGGLIYGPDTGMKITIDGIVVINDQGRVQGDNSVTDLYALVQIPPCKCEASILIEAYNRSGAPADFGWRFYHT